MRRVLFVVFLLSGVWLGAQDLDSTIVVIQAGDTLIRYHYSVFDYGAINEALPEEIPEPAAIPMGDDIRRSADLSWRHERRPKTPIPGSIVGEIPYTEGNTPSGGKTITVPILQAANAPCPQIALSYSSQAGNGEAGYGWSISGLSSIRCVAACAHFDGTPSPAHPSEGPFALDGVRLISNTDSRMSDYQWITSTGFIYVKEVRLGGELRAFEASCPDGSMMRFGWTDSETEKTSYPLTYVKYRDGFRVRIEYLSNQNTFYPTRIQYGSVSGNYPCEIQFSYGGRSDIETGYYCGMEARREKVLTSIDSKEGGQVLRHYGLTHEDNGRAYTLVKLNCSVGASAYYPLVFDYGDNSHPDSFSNDGRRVQLMGNALADPCVKRGRFIRGQASDGLIVMPEYSIPYGLLINNGVASFGSLIPEMQKILIAPTVSLGKNTSEIYAGEGFQTIDAIDVDGNGIDEIVKINLVAASSTTTRMQIDTYTFRSPSMSGSGLSITGSKSLYLGGMVTQGNVHGPRWRKYYYGDFRGDGKTMLLSIVLKSSQFTTEASSIFDLIDINEGALISSTSPFDISFRGEGSVFVMDVDGDAKMELCRLLSSSLEVYSLEGTQFMLKDTYSFSGDYHTKRMQICDMNGDGLLDLMFLPNIGSIWTCFLNTGTGFVKEERSYPNLAVWGAQKVLMQDVNHDGKSDYLRVNGNQVDVFLNRYGELSLTAASSIQVPGDAVLPGLNICDGIHIATPVTFEGNMMHTLVFKGDERFSNVLRYMRDSRGNPHQFFYTDMTLEGGAYESGSSEYSFPYYPVRFPLLLLSEDLSYMSGEPDEMTSLRRYTYMDAVAHRTGLGFCGFAQTKVTDEIQEQTEEVRYDPECMGVPVWNGVRLTGAQSCFKEKSFLYDGRKDMTGKWDPALIETVETDLLDSIVVRHGFEVDSFGYMVSDTLTYPAETSEYRKWVKRKEMLHVVSNNRYLTGLPVYIDNVVYRGAQPGSYVQFVAERDRDTINYNAEYYPSLIKKSRHYSRRVHTRLQSESASVSSTRYTYDIFGHVIQEETKTRESASWISRSWQYSLDGRFCIAKTDELGLTESYSDFDRYGQPRQISDHAGRVTIRTFDTSGRLVRETLPTGEQKIMSVAWDGADRSWFETLSGSAIPTQKVYYDPLGRKKKTAVERFDGQWQQTVFHYDEKGRLNRQSRPFRNSATGWMTWTYDDYNRVISKSETSGTSASWTYSPRTVCETKESVVSTKRTDHCGRTMLVTDAGGTVSYTYDLCDRILSISAPGNTETLFSYNLYGDRTSMEDPSAGLQTDTLRYAADGTSVQLSTNPNGTLRTHYDIYGRPVMIERSDGFSTAYTYGNTGLLLSAVSGNGTGKVYTYDAFDRLLTETETGINGIQFTRRFQYDSLGRVASVMSLTEADTLATEEYGYSRGWKSEVRLGDSTLVWRLEGENDFGQPVAATTGSMERMYTYDTAGRPARRKLGTVQDFSYHFDSETGNLLSRKDEIRQKTESFTYDNLNRLISAGNHSYIYDSKGNIISKTGYGAISYADTLHPYQATALLPDGNYMPTSNQTAVFSSYHRPSTLSENGWDISWDYNDAHDRVRMMLKKNGTARLKRHYLGDGVYERDENVGNVTERLYLGGDAYSAPMVYIRENNGAWSALNIGRDYLGSVTHVATADGVLLAEYSYDAWGRRRNPDTWGYYLSLSQEPELLTGRGYTGHEALPEIGLINMNARLYDPYLGRFLSPDPYVQAPDFTQNFNRYSYALNNPLKYTDESGEWLHLLIGGLIGGIANVIANWKNIQSHDDNQFLWGLGYFGVGALAGSLSAGIGAGVSSSLAGASFGAGFWGTSSAATAASSFLTGAAIGASAGGTNGFITGMGNSLMGGSSFTSSLGNGVLDAVSQGFLGGLAGGLAGGISAKIKGNRFWDGASIMDHTMYDQQIPFVEQFGADNCLPASVESVDKSFGGNISQYDIRSHFGGDPNIDMLPDADVWTYYCKRSNHTLSWENSPFRRVGQSLIHMGAGDRVAITLDTSLGGHSVLLSKVVYQQVTKMNGDSFWRFLYYVTDPARGSNIRIRENAIRNALNVFFIVP